MTSGGHGAPHFRRYTRELVSKPAISLKKCWGGYRRTSPCFPKTLQTDNVHVQLNAYITLHVSVIVEVLL